MSLPEGSLIVFSRGLRHIAHDSRNSVVRWFSRYARTALRRCPGHSACRAIDFLKQTHVREVVVNESGRDVTARRLCPRRSHELPSFERAYV